MGYRRGTEGGTEGVQMEMKTWRSKGRGRGGGEEKEEKLLEQKQIQEEVVK